MLGCYESFPKPSIRVKAWARWRWISCGAVFFASSWIEVPLVHAASGPDQAAFARTTCPSKFEFEAPLVHAASGPDQAAEGVVWDAGLSSGVEAPAGMSTPRNQALSGPYSQSRSGVRSGLESHPRNRALSGPYSQSWSGVRSGLESHPRNRALSGPYSQSRSGVRSGLESHPRNRAPSGYDSQGQPDPPSKYSLRLHVPLAVALGSLAITMEVLIPRIGPSHCRFCEDKVNPLDTLGTRLRWSHTDSAEALSSAVAYGVVPALSLGILIRDSIEMGKARRLAHDVLLIAEAMALSALVVQGVKYGVARVRPDAGPDPKAGNAFLSFPSGHTAAAFSVAVASGTLATMRRYPHRWQLWTLGLTFAALTGYLRVAAHRHYISDVLAGAAVGSFFGWAIPWVMFHL